MSKTHVEQVQKALMLVAGLRKNVELVKNRGINNEQIRELEQMANELGTMDKELDNLRLEVSQKTKKANQKLMEMKGKMIDLKKIVKHYFDSSRWKDFGVQDKR